MVTSKSAACHGLKLRARNVLDWPLFARLDGRVPITGMRDGQEQIDKPPQQNHKDAAVGLQCLHRMAFLTKQCQKLPKHGPVWLNSTGQQRH